MLQPIYRPSSQSDLLYLPLFASRVPAGFPSPAADYQERMLDLNEYLIQDAAATFMLRVSGDSMSGAGIASGDLLVVDRALLPQHGQIVLAVVDGDFTVKRLYRQHGRLELRAENPAYAPICLADGQELQIWGVVTACIKRFA